MTQPSMEKVLADTAAVTNLAEHFGQLKQRATELIDEFDASKRGYFTPTEDEATRHLLVSYWQSRNALIELVGSYRDYERFDESVQQAAFLTAYAGALLLVDAARFLREHAHSRPVIRTKLNEPEPHFGIPSGTYDRIQKSLTSPRHAWHLYHAIRYYDSHRDELRSFADTTPDFKKPLEIIDKLENSLDVDIQRFAVARARVRARSLKTKVAEKLLGRSLYGLQKCVSGLMAEKYVVLGHKPSLPRAIFDEISELIRPGDVFVVRKLHAITNYFLPGYWPHAALYMGTTEELKSLGLHEHDNLREDWPRIESLDAEPHRALEALADGVRVRPLARALASDAVTVLRPQLSDEQVGTALARGFSHEGKPYDFDFDFTRSDRMVCTEVVYRTFEGVGDMKFQLTKRVGRLTLAAEDLIRMSLSGSAFDVVALFSPEHSDQLLLGDAAKEVLGTTVSDVE